jgi:23S rRNA-intervening sequence protein
MSEVGGQRSKRSLTPGIWPQHEVEAMDKPRAVEDLEVFKKAYRISLDVHRRSLDFPPIEQYALGDQVRRASKGICANLAEGLVVRRRRRRSSSALS